MLPLFHAVVKYLCKQKSFLVGGTESINKTNSTKDHFSHVSLYWLSWQLETTIWAFMQFSKIAE